MNREDEHIAENYFFDWSRLDNQTIQLDIKTYNELDEISDAWKCPVQFIGDDMPIAKLIR